MERRTALRAAALAAFAAPYLAGPDVSAASGEMNPTGFGAKLCPLGDVDGDGVADFAIGALRYKCILLALSGKTGKRIWYYERGQTAVGIADQNGDGRRDVLLSADETDAFAKGPVCAAVCDGDTLKRIRHVPGSADPEFAVGHAEDIAPLGDVNGDGKPEFLFTHLVWMSPDTGEWTAGADVVVRSLDGTEVARIADPKPFPPGRPYVDRRFRSFVAGPVGDLDGDGKTDLAVTCFPARGLCSFEIVSAANVPIARWKDDRGYLPAAVVPFADADGDGTPDVLVGDTMRNDAAGREFTGEVRIVSGRTGKTVRVVKGAHSGDALGSSVAATSDLDGDGFPDFVAGAPWADRSRTDVCTGEVRAYSGKSAKLLWVTKGPKDRALFGAAVCAIGDRDGDGTDDVAASSPGCDLLKGSVLLLSGRTGKEIQRIDE